MPAKKTEEPEVTQEEIVAAMDAQVAAAIEDPSIVHEGPVNDGGFVQETGHGWSDEEVAIRAWTGADGEPHPGAAIPVAMDTGTKTSK